VLDEKIPFEDLTQEKTSPIKSTPSKFWRCLKESRGTRRFGCARFNGATTQKKRLHGKEKTNSRQNF
jgi:hypothetical protein